MILNIKDHNIFYVCLYHSIVNDINKRIKLSPLGKTNIVGHYPSAYERNGVQLDEAKGIFLGSACDIYSEINKKLIKEDFNKIKTVYFDKLSKYPRSKLRCNSEIKTTLSPDKTDAAVIPNYQFYSRNATFIIYSKPIIKCKILYSKETNNYYLIEFGVDSNKYFENLKDLLEEEYFNENEDSITNFIKSLIAYNILPLDVITFYEGEVVLLREAEVQFVSNLFNKYNSLIYDIDLDKISTKNLPKMTIEDYNNINNMLKSFDLETVNLGVKLLSGFNFTSSMHFLILLIKTNWDKIKTTKAFNSNYFKNIIYNFPWSKNQINLYNVSTLIKDIYNDLSNDDKIDIKNILCKILTDRINNLYIEYWKSNYKFLNINIKVLVEPDE